MPEFIIKNALRNLKLTKTDFFNILFDVKEKDNPKDISETSESVMDGDLCYCGSGKKYKNCHGK